MFRLNLSTRTALHTLPTLRCAEHHSPRWKRHPWTAGPLPPPRPRHPSCASAPPPPTCRGPTPPPGALRVGSMAQHGAARGESDEMRSRNNAASTVQKHSPMPRPMPLPLHTPHTPQTHTAPPHHSTTPRTPPHRTRDVIQEAKVLDRLEQRALRLLEHCRGAAGGWVGAVGGCSWTKKGRVRQRKQGLAQCG